MPSVRFGNHRISLPGSRLGRIVLGVALMMGGFLWFLPVLGLWMLPLGLVVLSVDFPFVRRWRRQQTVNFGRRWGPTLSRWRDALGRRWPKLFGRGEGGTTP
ncbi:MAG: hypothetical protein U1E56_03215 [Bauldia sp.]